jgi:hypothetical protein
LLGLITALVAAALLILGPGARPAPRHDDAARAFQRLVGGLGFGPSADLSDGPLDFDPRLDPGGAPDLGPLPAGGYVGPRGVTSVLYYPPLAGGPGPQGG